MCSLFLLLPVLVLALFIYSKLKHRYFSSLGIPGPSPKFLFGIFPSYKKKGLVWTDLELVKTHGKVVGIYHGHNPTLLVADPAMIHDICVNNSDLFLNRYKPFDMGGLLNNAVALAENDHWKFLRCKILPVFTPDKCEQITHILHECVDNLIDNLNIARTNHKSIDVTKLCSAYSMDIVLHTILGKQLNSGKNPDDETVSFVHKTWKSGTSGCTLSALALLVALFPSMRNVLKMCNLHPLPNDIHQFFTQLTKKRLQEMQNNNNKNRRDLFHCLTDSSYTTKENYLNGSTDNRDLTDHEVTASILFFVMAGYDTTANALAFLFHSIATNPKCQDILLQEINSIQSEKPSYEEVMSLPYLDQTISECLRLYPPMCRLNRTATEDISVQGYKIPRGIEVAVPIFALHRDPTIWEHPEKFDPERFSKSEIAKRPKCSYMPFGAGARKCLSLNYTVFNVKLACVQILKLYKFNSTVETEISPKLEKGMYCRPENGIWLGVENR